MHRCRCVHHSPAKRDGNQSGAAVRKIEGGLGNQTPQPQQDASRFRGFQVRQAYDDQFPAESVNRIVGPKAAGKPVRDLRNGMLDKPSRSSIGRADCYAATVGTGVHPCLFGGQACSNNQKVAVDRQGACVVAPFIGPPPAPPRGVSQPLIHRLTRRQWHAFARRDRYSMKTAQLPCRARRPGYAHQPTHISPILSHQETHS